MSLCQSLSLPLYLHSSLSAFHTPSLAPSLSPSLNPPSYPPSSLLLSLSASLHPTATSSLRPYIPKQSLPYTSFPTSAVLNSVP